MIEDRSPKVIENTKRALFIRGGRTSELVTQALKDLVSLAMIWALVEVLNTPVLYCHVDHVVFEYKHWCRQYQMFSTMNYRTGVV